MKFTLTTGSAAAMLAVLVAGCGNNEPKTDASAPAAAVNLGELKLAYVNNDSLMEQYKLTADMQEELIQQRIEFENKFRVEYEKLEKDFQDAEAGAAQLSPEALQILQSKLAEKENSLRNYKTQLDEELYSIEEQKNQKYLDAIHQFLEEYSKAKGYHIIFGHNGLGNVLYMDKQFDITNEVVDSLNVIYDLNRADSLAAE